jgi:hypothetical protein
MTDSTATIYSIQVQLCMNCRSMHNMHSVDPMIDGPRLLLQAYKHVGDSGRLDITSKNSYGIRI